MPAGFWISFGAIWVLMIAAVIFLESSRRIFRKERERQREGQPLAGDAPRDT